MKMRHAIAAPVIAFAVLLFTACSKEEKKPEEGAAPYSKGSPDQAFFDKAAQINLTEISAGRLALSKSSNPEVDLFAKHMVEDHSKANGELTSLADKKRVKLPTHLDQDHQKAVDQLSGKSGKEFDQAYSEMMVTGHVNAISLYQEAAKGSVDPDVRSYAQSSLKMLQNHLQMARDLKSTVGAAHSE
jgi:putative membrane protein